MTLILALAYLIGSVPFAVILSRRSGAGDLRRSGSGNVGAANVFRVSGPKAGLLVATLDIVKGAVSVALAERLAGDVTVSAAAACAAVVGHVFPVWLGFRGGKGVATYIGVLLGLYWPAALVFCAVWLLVAAATRYSSLAALAASVASIGTLAVTGEWRLTVLCLLLTILLYIRHASNIERLARGEEARIGETKL